MTEPTCPLSDDDLRKVLAAERASSVGFDHDDELANAREASLGYYKGEMKDVPALPNRSKAVDSTLADTIDALIPDLMEIFVGGDDVATFKARGPEDEAGAQQETDYVNHVVFEENPGWLTFATTFKDALLCKLGVFAWWWENAPADQWEAFKGKTQADVAAILQAQGGAELLQDDRFRAKPSETAGAEPLYDIEIKRQGPDGRVRVAAWAPEDFTVASDTVVLADTTYCAGRSRLRAQELKAEGFNAALVDQLPECSKADDETDRARDQADESKATAANNAARDLRTVEVVDHFIRLQGEDGQLELWRVKTGKDEEVILRKERVERIHYDTITPDIAAHRLYGRSMYDILGELQRIKTALTRGWLDSIYFALNGRSYVDMNKVNEFTLSDLLDNRPGMPVRGQGEGAVTPLSGPPIRADVFASGLEYFSVAAEHRTGVVRNAQGLNPDTLHDTAKGAEMLMTAAQKRVRMIARIFAETGVRGLFLGVHALLRQHASKAAVVRLRGSWVQVDPTTWGERNDMTIEIGLGSAGRAQDVALLNRVLELQERCAALPGAAMLVTPQNAYAALTDLVAKSGSKKGSMYFTDPATVPPAPPQPHPEVVKAQVKAQGDAMKAQSKADLDIQVAGAKLNLQREQITAETDLKREEMLLSARVEAMKAAMGAHASVARVEYGGEPG